MADVTGGEGGAENAARAARDRGAGHRGGSHGRGGWGHGHLAVAGTGFGMALLWAVVLGALLKCFLTEGIGRWYMASGETILEGWHSIGRLASGYFVMYLLIATFVFGAAITSTCALAVNAMFPDVLPQWAWAALHAVAAFLLIGVGRYGLFERIMKLFAAVKFGIVVLLGVLLAPSLSELALGLVPRVPEGSFWNILAVIGGVGGTFTLASYGYWVREHGWRRPEWVPTMRIDVVTGYVLTGVFMVSMMIVGAQLLYGTGTSIEGSEGLVTLANPLEERFGPLVRWLFLIGFWAVATGAMLGSWNGGAHLFADYVRIARGVSDQEAAEGISEKSPWFRAFLVWITFPPMVLLIFGRPITLVIVYASLGALFFPFLALTLLYLLNSRRVDPEYRNRTLTNVVLVAAVLLFIAAGVQEVLNGLSGRAGG